MLLAIDVGNTRIKAAVFEGYRLLDVYAIETKMVQKEVKNIFGRYPEITAVIVASVGNLSLEFLADLSGNIRIHLVSHLDEFPFTNLYETPSSLGIDRMVLASGGVFKYPKCNRLIIDAGTCITYDIVDSDDKYLGGAISPGFKLRYASLHNYTAKLPLLSLQPPENYIGNSTTGSIHSGVVNGIINEIEGYANRFMADYENFTIILTGGDADFLAKRLKSTIFANSNFLLVSLNLLFQFKIKNG